MLKKLLIINVLYIICALAGFCNIEDKLTNIEYAKYGESFTYETISDRLNRLETDYFGMAQTGDIDSRIDMLSTMSKNSKQMISQNPYDSYYAGQKRSKLRNFWDNVTSTFDTTGTMTGYTPSITTTTNGYNNYGYPNNMYRNEFLNFMNNPNQYCPYHNRYHSNNIVNRVFNNPNNIWNRNINNRYYNPYHYRHNPYINNNLYNPYNRINGYNPYNNPYNPRYSSRTTYYTPPNVATRSSVQIIKD